MKTFYCLHPNPKFDRRKPKGPDNQENFWRKVGTGFDNRDGSVNVFLDMFPGTTFQLREMKEQDEREPGADDE